MNQNNPEQENTDQSPKSGKEVAKQIVLSRSSKSHPDFWRKRLFHPAYTRDGKKVTLPEWAVRIQFRGDRDTFAFGTSNQAKAATEARDIFASLLANGWTATRAKFKPEHANSVPAPTVGQFLKAAQAVATIAPGTFNTYAVKFRSVVAGVMHIDAAKVERTVINPKTGQPVISRKTGKPKVRSIDPRFDYANGGAAEWRTKVDAVRLDRITPEAVHRWVTTRLQSAVSVNPAKAKSARTTINSILRAGGSLFTDAITRHLKHLHLPSPLPFEGVDKPAAPRNRYVSRIGIELLQAKAELELRDATGPDAGDSHELYCIYLLALFAGLRRDEIDTLTWDQIDWHAQTLRIETNEHTAAKSDDSHGAVTLAPEVLAYLKTKHATRTSQFVIESPVRPRPAVTSYHHYRCTRLFARLIAWLRTSGGVKARNPVHTLRKEFGSALANRFGIFAASAALRHADIRQTRDYYTSPDKRATFGPASLSSVGLQDTATQATGG